MLAWWEKAIRWWSRLYGWVYLPLMALMLGTSFPGGTDPAGKFCYNGIVPTGDSELTTSSNAQSFGINNVLLVIQFVLLLGLFVQPMLVRVEGAQSGGAVYRRVVLRNVFCTAGIVISYAITTLVVVIALLRESVESNKSAQIRDVALAANSLGTLCLTEITLPLGFRSCMKACSTGTTMANSTKTQAAGQTTANPGTAAAGATTNPTTTTIKIVPLEELPPQAP
ncbi:unnamed protein product [Ectocarpus sp. 4 AP-2014]